MTHPLIARRERIYLTGFMGSGKSTIGPILANTIGYDFVDIDRSIERNTGKTVEEIFRDSGERYFRNLERDFVVTLSSTPRVVVSLGGGTLTDPASFNIIHATGILVYLKTSSEQLFKRLQHKSNRPILLDPKGNRLDEDSLRLRIHDLFKNREPLYAKADIIIHTDETKVGITVDELVRKLSRVID